MDGQPREDNGNFPLSDAIPTHRDKAIRLARQHMQYVGRIEELTACSIMHKLARSIIAQDSPRFYTAVYILTRIPVKECLHADRLTRRACRMLGCRLAGNHMGCHAKAVYY